MTRDMDLPDRLHRGRVWLVARLGDLQFSAPQVLLG
jgi:hypothetical protein